MGWDDSWARSSSLTQPQKIWLEAGDASQSLNFDFLVENLAARLRYTFSLSIPKEAQDAIATVTVTGTPQVSPAKTALSMPIKGRLMVHDGHDYDAHHRRLNTEHPAAKELGLGQNFMRYSLDLNSANEHFDIHRGTGAKNEDWFAWDPSLYATGDGTVVDASDATPDNIRGGENFFKDEKVEAAPMHFYGNYLVIDHGNGEFSLLGHVQKGSLAVKVGDAVKRGQRVARIGNSGSSNNRHRRHARSTLKRPALHRCKGRIKQVVLRHPGLYPGDSKHHC